MHVLISGAGMAGLATAFELGTRGHEVTVVEYGHQLRLDGTPIDIRGDAIETVERMGLLGKLTQQRLEMSETSQFVDADGRPIGRVPLPGNESGDIEILREDLVRVLAEALPDAVTVRFGDSIKMLTDCGDNVDLCFASGRTGLYDLVIGADGQHSAVRELVFGPERRYLRHLGVYFGLANLPGEMWPDYANSIHNVPDRLAGVFQYKNRTVAVFQFRSRPLDYDHHDVNAQKRLLVAAFAGYRSWKIPQLLDAACAGPDFFLDAAGQIHMPSWHRGRVVLVGDGGYCPVFLSGRGTSLALTGAGFLVDELQQCGADHTTAFERYEARQRPYVGFAQDTATHGREHLLPATWDDITARNARLHAGGHTH